MRILLDVDGVLADFVQPVLDYAKTLTGRTYTHEDVTQWDIAAAIGVGPELWAVTKKPGFCEALAVIPGSQEMVKQLQAIGDVYIATSPTSSLTWAGERATWLRRHFDIPQKKIISTHAKYAISGHFLIDDKAANLMNWEDENPDGVAILVAAPWNSDDTEHLVAKSLSEIPTLVQMAKRVGRSLAW